MIRAPISATSARLMASGSKAVASSSSLAAPITHCMASRSVGNQLIENPDLANDPGIAARLLASFLKTHEVRIRAALTSKRSARSSTTGQRWVPRPRCIHRRLQHRTRTPSTEPQLSRRIYWQDVEPVFAPLLIFAISTSRPKHAPGSRTLRRLPHGHAAASGARRRHPRRPLVRFQIRHDAQGPSHPY